MDPVPVIAAVEAQGMEAATVGLIVAVSSAVTAIAGWIGRQGWDKRKAAQGGAQSVSEGDPARGGERSIGQAAYDAMEAHRLTCEELDRQRREQWDDFRKEMREEHEKLHARISESNKTWAQVQSDVSYIKGLIEGQQQRGQQP